MAFCFCVVTIFFFAWNQSSSSFSYIFSFSAFCAHPFMVGKGVRNDQNEKNTKSFYSLSAFNIVYKGNNSKNFKTIIFVKWKSRFSSTIVAQIQKRGKNWTGHFHSLQRSQGLNFIWSRPYFPVTFFHLLLWPFRFYGNSTRKSNYSLLTQFTRVWK